MQEYLYDTVAVLIEILLKILYLFVALSEEYLVALADIALSHVVLRLDIFHLYRNKILIVAAVEYRYLTASRQILVDTPEIVMGKFLRIRSFIGMYLNALRIDAAENIFY